MSLRGLADTFQSTNSVASCQRLPLCRSVDYLEEHCSECCLDLEVASSSHRQVFKICTAGLLEQVECNHRCRNRFVEPAWFHGSKPLVVIGLTRIYCYQLDEFCLVDVFSQDASKTVEQLREQGWDIEAEIPV